MLSNGIGKVISKTKVGDKYPVMENWIGAASKIAIGIALPMVASKVEKKGNTMKDIARAGSIVAFALAGSQILKPLVGKMGEKGEKAAGLMFGGLADWQSFAMSPTANPEGYTKAVGAYNERAIADVSDYPVGIPFNSAGVSNFYNEDTVNDIYDDEY